MTTKDEKTSEERASLLFEGLKKIASDFKRIADEYEACIQYNRNHGC